MSVFQIRKLKTQNDEKVNYYLPGQSGDDLHLNPLINKDVQINFTGNKYCISTGKKIKQTYGQGYSWEEYVTLAQCDECIVRPELCHYSQGTCREPSWGEKHCFVPHVIYLSLTSDLKIGITRKTQVPTRWIDQGASKAIKIAEVKDRKTSGLVEFEIAKDMKDKTNWIKMLKNESTEVDLLSEKKKILENYKSLFNKYEVSIADDEIVEINYPVIQYPTKVKQINLDKVNQISEKLLGIKGQYLIFESGVLNMRKHQGYEIEIKG